MNFKSRNLVYLIIVGFVLEILCDVLSWVLTRSSIGVLEQRLTGWPFDVGFDKGTDGLGDAVVGAVDSGVLGSAYGYTPVSQTQARC